MQEDNIKGLRVRTITGKQWIVDPKECKVQNIECFKITHRKKEFTAFQETTFKWEKASNSIDIYVAKRHIEQFVELQKLPRD